MCNASQPENLYSQEQQDEVAQIKDEHLRDALLHTIRLRDNMEQDRNRFEKRCNYLTEQVKQLRKDLLVCQDLLVYRKDYKSTVEENKLGCD